LKHPSSGGVFPSTHVCALNGALFIVPNEKRRIDAGTANFLEEKKGMMSQRKMI
jgi:hypothetical protein